jgi:hypothetical protein
LNVDNLAALIDYMERAGLGVVAASVLPVSTLPVLLNENGPSPVSAGRDTGDATQINIGYSAPPDGYTAEIYFDGVFAKESDLAPSGGTVWDILPGIANDGAPHNIRVLFVDGEGRLTRFGPIAQFT